MPKPRLELSRDKVIELARLGAAEAVRQLRREIIAIERAFPELRLPRRRRAIRKAVEEAAKKTRTMSVAARKAVSRRMKRYRTKLLRGSYFSCQLPIAA